MRAADVHGLAMVHHFKHSLFQVVTMGQDLGGQVHPYFAYVWRPDVSLYALWVLCNLKFVTVWHSLTCRGRQDSANELGESASSAIYSAMMAK